MASGFIWNVTTGMATFATIERHAAWAGWSAADYARESRMTVHSFLLPSHAVRHRFSTGSQTALPGEETTGERTNYTTTQHPRLLIALCLKLTVQSACLFG